MGEAGQAMNITHQQKKLHVDQLKKFRDQFRLPIADEDLVNVPYLKFEEGSKELEYMRARRQPTSAAICRRVARRPSRCRCRNCRHSSRC
jgi:pyruvate dehydrogenase complex dehydrogenase (E1) component